MMVSRRASVRPTPVQPMTFVFGGSGPRGPDGVPSGPCVSQT